jgi:hypothetical protein
MVEILLSLIFLVASVALASRPRLGIHDRTIDGLFLTLTGACHVPAIPVQLHLPTAL